jgi:hypothetical protein
MGEAEMKPDPDLARLLDRASMFVEQAFKHQDVEAVYNRRRLHSAPAYRPPAEFEQNIRDLEAATDPPQDRELATSP